MKFDTCAKFHDHRSNNNKVMMGAPMADGSKKIPCQIGFSHIPLQFHVQGIPKKESVKNFYSDLFTASIHSFSIIFLLYHLIDLDASS